MRRTYRERLGRCSAELQAAFHELDHYIRIQPHTTTCEAAKGLGLIYKYGHRTPVRIDPVPAGWLGIFMPLDQDRIHRELVEEIRTGIVGRRDGMQAQRTWIDVRRWNPILANRLKRLIDTAYEKVSNS